MLGRTEPRLWTPPLRELTPDTSYGFDVITFARDVLRHPLDPWQEWAVIHAGELLYDGRPRFRIVLILVARQNGKTETPVILSAYWQFIEKVRLIVGTSTKLEYAKESWKKLVEMIDKCDDEQIRKLRGPGKWTRDTNGEQECWTRKLDRYGNPVPGSVDSRYKIAASNEEGGRSLTINRLILDELRQHHDYSAFNAAEPAASPLDAQIYAMSNAGDDNSIVLNDHRDQALEFIEWWDEHGSPHMGELLLRGEPVPGIVGDYRLGMFEWSAPVGSDPSDIHALAMANPNMNRRSPDGEVLQAKGARALAKGGQALAGFYTENMCIRVPKLDPAINPQLWKLCLAVGTLDGARSRIALCLDVSPDELHVSLIAAAVMDEDRVRVEAIAAWEGTKCIDDARRDLPGIARRVRPQVLGWFPNGPAAALAADLKPREGRRPLLPTSVKIEPIQGEAPAVCMGFAEQVKARKILQSGDPLIDDHVLGAEALRRGATWVFSRKGGHCDAAYGVAGAVHLARTLPAPVGKPRLVVAE